MTSDAPPPPRTASNVPLAAATLLAAIFVAVQAWYARVAYVESSETRFLEEKLDLCFQTFDAAVALDGGLRELTPGIGADEEWPPKVDVMRPAELRYLQVEVVPLLNRLQSNLAKASILGPLDRFRQFLSSEIEGLSQRIAMLSPARLDEAATEAELTNILDKLSDFLGAQYSVFEGCRQVAEGEV